MFYIKVSTILIALAVLIALVVGAAVIACCAKSSQLSRKEEREESCRKCPGYVAGRCECRKKTNDPCATCWEMGYKTCEGCHRRKC